MLNKSAHVLASSSFCNKRLLLASAAGNAFGASTRVVNVPVLQHHNSISISAAAQTSFIGTTRAFSTHATVGSAHQQEHITSSSPVSFGEYHQRTQYCGEVNQESLIGKSIKINGWVENIRVINQHECVFLTIRDVSGVVQVILKNKECMLC